MAPIRLLLVEDNEADAELVLREVRTAGLEVEHRRVESAADLADALQEFWSAILCDYTLPGWDGLAALGQVRNSVADVPFLFVSGTIGEEVAVAAMRAGADDYLLKDNLKRLGPALIRELQAHEDRLRAREAESARARTESRYAQVLHTAADAIISIGLDQRIQTFNRGAERIFGYEPSEVLGHDLGILVPERMREKHRSVVADFLAGEPGDSSGAEHADVVALRKDGTEFPAQTTLSLARDGSDFVATAILRDMSGVRKSEERIRFLAHFDQLTELPNRILFRDRLENACLDAKRRDRRVAVAVLDLDRFKIVNDTWGHNAGDELLAGVASRLTGSLRAGDTVARMGGDEFGVILADLAADEDAGRIIEMVIRALRYPIMTSGGPQSTTASAGVTLFPVDGRDQESLLTNADLAMYRAKRAGGDRLEFYQPEMTVRERDRAELESHLVHSLRVGGLSAQFQPQIEIATGRVVGCEALARWEHPVRGFVPPADFVHAAENSGQIALLDHQILKQGLQAAVEWNEGACPVPVGVNVSLTELLQPDYPERVLAALDDEGIDPGLLRLEVPEAELQDQAPRAMTSIWELERAGVRFAIDGFGANYSNLSRLRHSPFRTLKIAKCLVRALPDDTEAAAIVSAIMTAADRLGLQVIGVGADSEEQLDALAELGCGVVQGFALARPMWPTECLNFVRAARSVGGAAGLPQDVASPVGDPPQDEQQI